MPEQLRIVLAGGAGAMPFAGVSWQVLHYLEGLRRLGHEVYYLEDTQRWPYDPVADSVVDDARPAVAYVAALMARCGCEERWAFRDVASGDQLYGPLSEAALARVLATADVLINLSGVTVLREEHLGIPVRVYLETDPVLPQIEVSQGRRFTIELLAAHTHHFSFGENLGAADCGVPVERFSYLPTRQPVVVEWWAPDPGWPRRQPGMALTTVANWRQAGKDIEFQGQLLTWSKHVEFQRFIGVAAGAALPIELALAADETDLVQLRRAGWRVRGARPFSADLEAYRSYIRSSAGEFSVAKEQNVKLRSGWFSDRTASYLAAGRPAVVQDTAFDCALPVGEGLLPFRTPDEARAAIAELAADYPRHCRAALDIAHEHLRAETVLGALLEKLDARPSLSRTAAAGG